MPVTLSLPMPKPTPKPTPKPNPNPNPNQVTLDTALVDNVLGQITDLSAGGAPQQVVTG